jgi:hypothetical protein
MSKTGVFSMSPILYIEQLPFLPLKARCFDFFLIVNMGTFEKYWTG